MLQSVSKERMAFINDSSKLLPIAITSPVAFIWVESLLSAVWNLSNGNLGNFLLPHNPEQVLKHAYVFPVTGLSISSKVSPTAILEG